MSPSLKKLPGIPHANKFILFLFCFFTSIHLSATDLEVATDPTNDGIIYVTNGATVYGENNISAVKVVSIVTEKKKAAKSQVVKKAPVSIVKKKVSRQLQDLQRKIDAYPHDLFQTPIGNDSIGTESSSFMTGTASSSNNYKIVGCVMSSSNRGSRQNFKVYKQKFYTSFSYLQFSRYNIYSLRGPPSF